MNFLRLPHLFFKFAEVGFIILWIAYAQSALHIRFSMYLGCMSLDALSAVFTANTLLLC